MKKISWSLAIVLALFLIFMGAQKFTDPNAVFSYIAVTTGINAFEPWVRRFIGAAEIVSALLLLWPPVRRFGLLLALVVLCGAIGFHLSPFLGINAPVSFAPDGEYVKSPILFFMALGFFTVALAGFLLEFRSERP